MESTYQIFITFLLLSAIIVDGWLWYFFYKQKEQTLSHKFLLWHIAGVFIWSVSVLLLLYYPHTILAATTFSAAFFFAISKYYFALTFPENTWPTGWWHYAVSLPAIVFIFLPYFPGVIFSNVAVINGYFFTLENGPLAGWYSLLVTYFLIYPIFHLLYKRRFFTKRHLQEQLRFLAYGMFLTFALALVTNSLLPVFFGIYNLNATGPILSVFLAGFIVYIISRYQFLELRLVIQRGLVYSILFAFIALLYVSTLAFTNLFIAPQEVLDDFFSGLLTSIVGIATVPRLDRWLRKYTDHWFFKDTYNYQEALQDLSETLQSTLDMDELLSLCEEKLTKILRAEFVNIKSKSFEQSESEITIPIKLNDRAIGTIALGSKRSGEGYTEEDLMLITTFATQAATALSRVFLYQEVRRRAEELEVKVIERTQELQTTQENQRDMMLHISHNLQTPLAILQTKIESIKKQSEATSEITSLEQSLQQTSQFIHDLLRFARLDSNYEELEVTDVNVSQVVTELAEEIQIIAATNEITVNQLISPDVVIQTDRSKLREVIMNLASNAIKYMGDQSERTIDFSLSTAKDMVTITITDTGVGIEAKDVERIFNNFYRAQNSTMNKGTGLGLAITKQIITNLGGEITLQSTPGVGSSFTITLPRTHSNTV